jgi:RNA polymerase sigma-32 factor
MPTARAGGWLDLTIRTQLNWSSLTAERERQLLRSYGTAPDSNTRHAVLTELWESHSKLVVAIAMRYRQRNIELVDLIGAGHLGLYTAITRFDADRFETRLATYATGWVRWHIQDYIRRNAGPVRLPATTGHRQLTRMSARLFSEARRSCQRDGVEPTDWELCERVARRIGLTTDEVARSVRLVGGGAISIQGETNVRGPSGSLEEILAAETTSPENDAIMRLDQDKAYRRIVALVQEILGERERRVFLARCFADDGEIVHLETLAREFGVTRERVYQLEASAKRKIATALAQEGYGGSEISAPVKLPAIRAHRRAASASDGRSAGEVSTATA